MCHWIAKAMPPSRAAGRQAARLPARKTHTHTQCTRCSCRGWERFGVNLSWAPGGGRGWGRRAHEDELDEALERFGAMTAWGPGRRTGSGAKTGADHVATSLLAAPGNIRPNSSRTSPCDGQQSPPQAGGAGARDPERTKPATRLSGRTASWEPPS